jgi:hypothetical protein
MWPSAPPKPLPTAQNSRIAAMKQYLEEGIPAKDIFRKAGFDLWVIGIDIPQNCIYHWLRLFKAKGI